MGLMQIMPQTWSELRARYDLGADPYDPRDNILAGAAYIRELYLRFGAPGFLAAYNAGPGRYENHLATDRPLPDETQEYVARLAPTVEGKQTGGKIAAVAKPSSFGWLTAVRCAHCEQLNARSAIAQCVARPSIKWSCRCRSIGARAAVEQPVRAPCQQGSIEMIQIVLHRSLSLVIACSDGMRWDWGDTSHGWQGKSADVRRAHVVGWIEHFRYSDNSACWLSLHKSQRFQGPKRRRRFSSSCERQTP